ncbi:MAG: serine dehydratase beta chain, partial [Tissierellia bacterium]|nr:serine dehydratase beta chain [Tissierellia bacterium]
MRQPASIFNDVIGPVMIGPSSSHTAASVRIGRLMHQLIKGKPKKVIFEFEPKGSLATTYHGQGSDIGLIGGLLNYETYDVRIVNSLNEAKNLGIEVEFNVVDYESNHPNTYRTTVVENDGNEIHATFLSTGGGMIEMIELEGFQVSITGGFFETIIFLKSSDRKEAARLHECIVENINEYDFSTLHENSNKFLINIKSQNKLSEGEIFLIEKNTEVDKIINFSPVLPIKSQKTYDDLFNTAIEIEKIAVEQNLDLWEIAINYESSRGNITKAEAYNKMKDIVRILKDSMERGKKGTSYEDRILGHQSNLLENDNKKFIPGNVFNSVVKHITLMMEIKSSMGVIVAAPTAGSCGALPGTIIGIATELGLDDDEI